MCPNLMLYMLACTVVGEAGVGGGLPHLAPEQPLQGQHRLQPALRRAADAGVERCALDPRHALQQRRHPGVLPPAVHHQPVQAGGPGREAGRAAAHLEYEGG